MKLSLGADWKGIKSLRSVPLKRKLMMVIMLTSTTALVVACAAYVALDLLTFRDKMQREITTLTRIIAAKSASAIIAQDPITAGHTLLPLREDPQIVAAFICAKDGKVLAKFIRPDVSEKTEPAKRKTEGPSFENGRLLVVRNVVRNKEILGTVFLQADLQNLYDRLRHYVGIILIVILASSAAAFVLSSRLQRVISEPILSLTAVARGIIDQKDYTLRAQKHGDHEIDLLVETFNQMLVQIHERDLQLNRVKDDLEKRVQARTYALQQELAERKRTEEQLRQSQKMEAIGRLAGGVAHDFNNVLTVITGYSDLLLRHLADENPLRRNAEEIQTAAQRAASLTRQLLAFSRKQVLQPKVLDLNTVVASMEKMMRRLIGEDIELQTQLAPQLGKVKADPGQVEQVIMNLAINARDAMPMGGKLRIETNNIVIDKDTMFQDGELDAREFVSVSIADNGVGMTEEVKLHLFEPFFTTKGKNKGTGLGLSTCYGIIKQSGGHINVYSEPGKGTTFRIYLPRVEKAAEALANHDEAKLLPQGKETVLLVEDEPAVRELAACVLRESGYRVIEASNGLEGIRVSEQHAKEKVHILISDVIMPQMGGKELVDRIKVSRPDTKVLFISGYTDDAILHHGVLEPGVAFLEKPFSPARLVHKVREVLDQPETAVV